MDRAKAKSMTRTVQTVAMLLVAATAVAALVPLSVKAEPVVDTSAAPPPKAKPVETPKVEIETTEAAAFLNQVSGPVKNQAVEQTNGNPTPPPPPPPTGVDSWKYLGGIISSTYKRAIVVIDEQQRLLAEGQTVNGIEVVQIDKSFVKVKQGETETTINIAPRNRPALTVLDPSAVAARAAANGANAGGSAGNANGAARGISGAAAIEAKNRQRDLQRRKDDAKARGDEKAAEMYDAELNGGMGGSGGKGEKGQK